MSGFSGQPCAVKSWLCFCCRSDPFFLPSSRIPRFRSLLCITPRKLDASYLFQRRVSPLKSSTSSSSNLVSDVAEQDLVSISELLDGSIIFRFGKENKILSQDDSLEEKIVFEASTYVSEAAKLEGDHDQMQKQDSHENVVEMAEMIPVEDTNHEGSFSYEVTGNSDPEFLNPGKTCHVVDSDEVPILNLSGSEVQEQKKYIEHQNDLKDVFFSPSSDEHFIASIPENYIYDDSPILFQDSVMKKETFEDHLLKNHHVSISDCENSSSSPLLKKEDMLNVLTESELKVEDVCQNNSSTSQISDLPVETRQNNSEYLTKEFFVESGIAAISDQPKEHVGGNDFFFATPNWIGIADGADEWSLYGSYPSGFAEELLTYCEELSSNQNNSQIQNPVALLSLATAKSEASGLCSVVLANVQDQVLHAANIGNTGFCVVRNGVIAFKSSPILLEFYFPLQLVRGDEPALLAEEFTFVLEEHDIIILGSNGLFDNLYAEELAPLATKLFQSNSKPQHIAEVLATAAHEMGKIHSGRSPFSDAAQAAGYVGSGGSLDDVSVIVSIVCRTFS